MIEKPCEKSHYVAIVEVDKGEIYCVRECASCMRRMAEQHEAIAHQFRTRLIKMKTGHHGEPTS